MTYSPWHVGKDERQPRGIRWSITLSLNWDFRGKVWQGRESHLGWTSLNNVIGLQEVFFFWYLALECCTWSNTGLVCKLINQDIVGSIGFGLVGLYVKSTHTGELFALCLGVSQLQKGQVLLRSRPQMLGDQEYRK